MFVSVKQIRMAAVIGLAGCVLAPAESRGQNRPRQMSQGMSLRAVPSGRNLITPFQQLLLAATFGLNPYSGIGNLVGLGSPYAGGINPYAALYSNPYAASGPYGSSSGAAPNSSSYSNPYSAPSQDPNGAYLNSAASGINAQGGFMTSQQRAWQIREQARGDRTASRRKLFDEYLYERDKTPSAEDERQKAQREQLNRSRHNPPVTEIWSGKALNELLHAARNRACPSDGAPRPTCPLPLDEAGLKHINVSKDAGSIALLKNDGRFDWPVALTGPELQARRDQLAVRAQAAARQAAFNGRVDPGLVRQVIDDLEVLDKQLRFRVKELSASEYMEARSFLQHFDEAVRALRQPDVGNHFTGKYALKAETVPELVRQMVDKGLHFAPALPGDEAAYRALHQALVTYDQAAQPR